MKTFEEIYKLCSSSENKKRSFEQHVKDFIDIYWEAKLETSMAQKYDDMFDEELLQESNINLDFVKDHKEKAKYLEEQLDEKLRLVISSFRSNSISEELKGEILDLLDDAETFRINTNQDKEELLKANRSITRTAIEIDQLKRNFLKFLQSNNIIDIKELI